MATKREISKEKTISAILEAAKSEFSEHGYNDATIRSIAAGAGVSSGLVCTYFETKEKLLREIISRYHPDVILEGLRNTDPYIVLCAYLDHIRALQKNDPVQFRLHLKIVGRSGFPESVADVLRGGFEGSRIETAIIAAQKRGQLVSGDPFRVFEILSDSVYVLLDRYAELGTDAPDNDAILSAVGWRRKSGALSGGGRDGCPADPFAGFTVSGETLPLITRLCERIPGGFFLYHADGDRELIAFNRFMVSMYGCADEDEFREFTGNSFRGLVHPDDYARVETEIAEQIKNSDLHIDHLRYRFIRRDGSVGTLDDYGHFSRSETFGDIFYVFVQDITKEYLVQQKADRLERLNRVLRDYDGVFLIDCRNDTRRTFHDRLSGASNYDDAERYSDAFSRYVDRFVCEPDQETMRAFADPANIPTLLNGREELSVTYRDRTTGTQRFYEMRILRYSETEILQSFRENDAEVVNRLLFEKLKEKYFAIFCVDLESGLMRFYKTDPLYAGGEEGSVTPLASVMTELASHFDGEAKAFFLRNSDARYIRERFAEEDRAEFIYKSPLADGKWTNATGIVFERNADGTPSLFCFAFNYLDERSAATQEMQLKLSEASQRTELFFDTFNAGQWIYEISADDEIVSASYSDAVHRNTNISTLSGKPMGWLDRLHPDDRERVLAAFMAPIRDHSGKTKYDVDFRILDDEGRFRRSKSAGRVIRRSDGSGEYFGMNIDITDEIRTQQEHQERLLKLREQEAVTRQFIEGFAGEYNLACKVRLSDDSCTLIRSDGKLKVGSLDLSRFSQITEYLLANGVFEPDRERVRRELDPDNIRRRLSEAVSFSVEYRVLSEGATRWDNMTVRTLNETDILVGFVIRNDGIILKHLQEREYENYLALFAIDLDTAQMTTLKNSSNYSIGRTGAAVPFRLAIKAYAGSLEGNAKEFFTRMSEIGNVISDHTVNNKLTYVYQTDYDGEQRWIRATSYVVMRHDDGSPAVLTLGFNLVDALGADRQEMERRLREALEEAQTANRAKSRFLFNMSHDIRTPMNAILGFTNIALKHMDDPEKLKDCLIKTQKSGGMLLSLINSVLEVSRIESGKVVPEEQPGDVLLSFANIESTLRDAAEAKDIALSFGFGSIEDRYVYADFGSCMRIFLNIISNAIQYTPDGGAVTVYCEQTGGAKNGRALYRYTVRDNGIGMSEEYLGRIFDQFTRENSTTVSGIQGSGLGMSVVRALVDLLGGTIDIRSRKGEGTEVRVVLPFRLQEELPQYTDPSTGKIVGAEERSAEHVGFSGKRVLLVEDNELNREIAAELLEDEGMLVEEAEDGTDAVELLREKGPEHYDFVLMDIQMPRMNGYEATRAIRAMYPDAKLPIIAVSANAFEEDRKKSFEAGMNDHVAKPIHTEELFRALREAETDQQSAMNSEF